MDFPWVDCVAFVFVKLFDFLRAFLPMIEPQNKNNFRLKHILPRTTLLAKRNAAR
jgi:hypothetical protein